MFVPQRKSAETESEAKAEVETEGASAAAADVVVHCDSGYPLALSTTLQVWDGTGDIMPKDAIPARRSSMEFHDVYGSTLSPTRQNQSLGQRSQAGASPALNLPGVVSETPYYYRKQQKQQKQQARFQRPAEAGYLKTNKTAAQVESEVDYELDATDEQWLEALNDDGKEKNGKDWGLFIEEHMEVLIDRYEKADAALHKLAGHSAVRTEVLLIQRPAVSDVRGVSGAVQQQVHGWWMEKRNKAGHQLLRRLRAPPSDDDDDDAKAFRRTSEFGNKNAPAPAAARNTDGHAVGDMVEANYLGCGDWHGGIIAAVNPNGSFAVKYHDGDCENAVPSVFIRKMAERRRRGPPPSTPSAAKPMASTPASQAQKATSTPRSAPPASATKMPPSPKTVGDSVEANYHGMGKFYTGTVVNINPNGTYRVQYHDGDYEDEVPGFDVHRLEKKRRRQTAPASMGVAPAAAAPKPAAALAAKPVAAPAPVAAAAPVPAAKPVAAAAPAEQPKPKVVRAPRVPKKNENLISKQKAFDLRSGNRIMLQWDEPTDKDHGVWFAATVTSDGTKGGWFQVEFDTFSVSNTRSWNLPYHASKGRLRSAATTAAARIRRGQGGPLLEWSRSMGGSIMPADQVTPRPAPRPVAAVVEPTPSPVLMAEEFENVDMGPPPSPKAVGDVVEANYHGRGQWHGGTVAAATAATEDGELPTYRIQYHDGDAEEVTARNVRRMATRRRPAPVPVAQPAAKRAKVEALPKTAPVGPTQPPPARATPRPATQSSASSSGYASWGYLWAELQKVGWREDSNPFGGVLYFAPGKQPKVLDSKAAVFRYLAQASARS